MKVETVDNDNTIVYLNKNIVRFIDFSNIEDSLEKVFNKLKNNYNIKVNGYLTINVYEDENYGVVIEIKHDEIDCFDYLDNYISINISKEKRKFLYEFDDINSYQKSYVYYDNKFYTDKLNIKYSDFYKVIYDEKVDKIRNLGKKIIL